MKIIQKLWTAANGWAESKDDSQVSKPQLVFVLGDTSTFKNGPLSDVTKYYPDSPTVFISSAGFIYDSDIIDNAILVTALYFDKTNVKLVSSKLEDPTQSEAIGVALAQEINKDGLKHVMLFSEGLIVRGAELVKGVNSVLSKYGVSVTGGLAGNWPNIEWTEVGTTPDDLGTKIIMIGFYGENIRIGYGSFGGWDIFGPERMITRSKGNVLYELDGRPALAIYKDYLGEKAKDLPLSGLLFPLQVSVRSADGLDYIIRNLININEDDGGLVFAAGDMTEGATARMMKGNFDRLIDGASSAAKMSLARLREQEVEFAFLVSCVGRRMVLKDRAVEELDAVTEVFQNSVPVITGFYSYAEICPVNPTDRESRLHNQTMTITTFSET